MNRRKFLSSVGVSSVIGLAGCAGSNNEDTDTPTEASVGEEDTGCTQTKLDEPGDTVRWEGSAEGTTEIDSVTITARNVKDFSVEARFDVFFYREQGDIEPATVSDRVLVLQGGESQTFTIEMALGQEWDVELELSCP